MQVATTFDINQINILGVICHKIKKLKNIHIVYCLLFANNTCLKLKLPYICLHCCGKYFKNCRCCCCYDRKKLLTKLPISLTTPRRLLVNLLIFLARLQVHVL